MFPQRWDSNPSLSSPPEFSRKALTARPTYHENGQVDFYCDLTRRGKRQNEFLTLAAFAQLKRRWEKDYPKKKHLYETKQHNVAQCSAKRQDCWDKLRSIDDVNIPASLRAKFKVDAYGNVIARDAKNMGLCGWDVDHIWPWSRGGRSVMSNFAAVQWACNRCVKNDSIHQTILDSKLRVGLTLEQFKALVPLMTGRKQADRGVKDKVMLWLTQSPVAEGRSMTKFSTSLCKTSNWNQLVEFFEQRDEEDKSHVKARMKVKMMEILAGATAPPPAPAAPAAPASQTPNPHPSTIPPTTKKRPKTCSTSSSSKIPAMKTGNDSKMPRVRRTKKQIADNVTIAQARLLRGLPTQPKKKLRQNSSSIKKTAQQVATSPASRHIPSKLTSMQKNVLRTPRKIQSVKRLHVTPQKEVPTIKKEPKKKSAVKRGPDTKTRVRRTKQQLANGVTIAQARLLKLSSGSKSVTSCKKGLVASKNARRKPPFK